MKGALKNKIKKIKLLALDVDGVLTDGHIIYDSEGNETKNFSVMDGFGLVAFKRMGYNTAIITARGSATVSLRAKDLHIDKVYLNSFPKKASYEKMLREFKLHDSEVCFVGDDLPDIPLLKRVGLAVAVCNAAPEVKKIADYVTKSRGGSGAVREIVEVILKSKGQWKKIIERYTS